MRTTSRLNKFGGFFIVDCIVSRHNWGFNSATDVREVGGNEHRPTTVRIKKSVCTYEVCTIMHPIKIILTMSTSSDAVRWSACGKLFLGFCAICAMTLCVS